MAAKHAKARTTAAATAFVAAMASGAEHAVEAIGHCTTDAGDPTATKIVLAATPNVGMAPDGAERLERTCLVEIRGVDRETATPYWMRTYGVPSCERMNDADGNPADAWRSAPAAPCEVNVSHAPHALTVTAWEIASVESTTTPPPRPPNRRRRLPGQRPRPPQQGRNPTTRATHPPDHRPLQLPGQLTLPNRNTKQQRENNNGFKGRPRGKQTEPIDAKPLRGAEAGWS